MMRIALFLLLLCGLLPAQAQEIQLNEDPRISAMLKSWTNQNRTTKRIAGWRVQVLSTTDRQQADLAKARVRSEYPNLPADWTHERPYYKLRVGACRTKGEAMVLLELLRLTYPTAYPAQDANIHPRDFLKQ
jgi:SPOR domain